MKGRFSFRVWLVGWLIVLFCFFVGVFFFVCVVFDRPLPTPFWSLYIVPPTHSRGQNTLMALLMVLLIILAKSKSKAQSQMLKCADRRTEKRYQ